jgi:sugar lactone lactonase YvrE
LLQGDPVSISDLSKQPVELVVDEKATVGEGPIWDPRFNVLWWIDVNQGKVHRYNPIDRSNVTLDVGQRVGTVVPRLSGGLMLAAEHGFIALDPETGAQIPIADPEADQPENRFNDGKCDPKGRFWAGTMEIAEEDMTKGTLYCLHTNGAVEKHVTGIGVSNGLVWTLDRKTMYYIDSPTRRVDVFDYDDETGSVENRRTAVALPEGIGFPDGMAIDAQDRLWIALWGGWGVTCFDPRTEKFLGTIPVPCEQVSACAFGGANLNQLFITTARRDIDGDRLTKQPHAGGLFVADLGVVGVEAVSYAG